jgi:hypothetical protein
MVGDLHFIIRHGLTGLVFLFFVVFGVWNWEIWFRNGCDIASYIMPQFSQAMGVPIPGARVLTNQVSSTQAITSHCTTNKIVYSLKDIGVLVLAFSPIIGISLQGAQIFRKYIRKELFTDDARTRISEMIIDRLTSELSSANIKNMYSRNRSSNEIEKYGIRLSEIKNENPDALYVWVYHTDANDRLIEWARRRRSYHYLGLHFFTAFFAGNFLGILIGFVINYNNILVNGIPNSINSIPKAYLNFQIFIQILLNLFFLAWGAAAYYLSKPMKTDADNMELAWSFGFIYPDIKKKIFADTRNEIKKSGSIYSIVKHTLWNHIMAKDKK